MPIKAKKALAYQFSNTAVRLSVCNDPEDLEELAIMVVKKELQELEVATAINIVDKVLAIW